MAIIDLKGSSIFGFKAKSLRSTLHFDSVDIEIKKPESFTNSGYIKTRDSTNESTKRNTNDLIVTDSPNFYNYYGESMDNSGYFIFPKSIWNDPRYQGARLKYKHVLHTILKNAAFKSRTHSIGINEIKVEVGQFCVTVRGLVNLCNEGVRFKEDLVDKNVVQRASHFFCRCGLLRQEVRHGKVLLTVTVPEFYANLKTTSETTSDTKVRLNRDTNEERKKEVRLEETIERTIERVDSFLKNQENENRSDVESVASKNLEKHFESNESAVSSKSPSIFDPDVNPNNFSEEKKKHYLALWELIKKHNMSDSQVSNGIKEKDLEVWMKKYDSQEIFQCLKITLKANPNKTWPGYVTKLLSDRIPKKEEDSKNGRKYVEEYVKSNKIKHIDLKIDYFKDLISNEQSYYNLPVRTLEGILKRSVERAEQKEREDREQRDYEENY